MSEEYTNVQLVLFADDSVASREERRYGKKLD